ncbi:DinB family protein [Spirosoma soli]|uniref:DinB family protein n=1 Tax=Spirosoma soli TaxID=1770529 RepID=A0ABW5M6P1_9BACT
MPISTSFETLFARDLSRLSQQIDAYEDESTLWEIAPGIHNSAGNLCLHLIGNLNTYIGANLGNIPYVRDRPMEFSARYVSKASLLSDLEETKNRVRATLQNLTDGQLGDLFPDEVLGYPMTIHYFLVHLAGHLNYHLGQIDYHRRLLTQGHTISYKS